MVTISKHKRQIQPLATIILLKSLMLYNCSCKQVDKPASIDYLIKSTVVLSHFVYLIFLRVNKNNHNELRYGDNHSKLVHFKHFKYFCC
jgi:hypothetical protein